MIVWEGRWTAYPRNTKISPLGHQNRIFPNTTLLCVPLKSPSYVFLWIIHNFIGLFLCEVSDFLYKPSLQTCSACRVTPFATVVTAGKARVNTNKGQKVFLHKCTILRRSPFSSVKVGLKVEFKEYHLNNKAFKQANGRPSGRKVGNGEESRVWPPLKCFHIFCPYRLFFARKYIFN